MRLYFELFSTININKNGYNQFQDCCNIFILFVSFIDYLKRYT